MERVCPCAVFCWEITTPCKGYPRLGERDKEGTRSGERSRGGAGRGEAIGGDNLQGDFLRMPLPQETLAPILVMGFHRITLLEKLCMLLAFLDTPTADKE